MNQQGQASSRQAGAGAVAASDAALKLLVKGFIQSEWLLLEAIVRLSQRRQPKITLLAPEEGEQADVVIIDNADAESKKWAAGQAWLQNKAVIWVDAPEAPGRTVVKRPVQWSALPVMLARVLEQSPSLAPTPASASPSVANLEKAAGGLFEAGPALSVNPTGSTSVLVVDDSLAVRSLLRSLLASHGLKVTAVDNAEAALKAAAADDFACVLLDVLMPGMDGYEACRQIKANAHGGNIPAVVMLTSKSSSFDRIRGKMAGCDAYLTKPIDPDYLSEIILRFITKAGAGNPVSSTRTTPLQYASS
jgi:twitching motility two-component system response regulator PilG